MSEDEESHGAPLLVFNQSCCAGVTAADPHTPNTALGWKSCDLHIWSWLCSWEGEGT